MARRAKYTPWGGSPGVVATVVPSGVLTALSGLASFSGAGTVAAAAINGALSAVAQAASFSGAGSAFSPLDVSNLLLWLDSTQTTNTGDGTAMTAHTDRGPNAASVVEGSSGSSGTGPLRLDPGSNRRGVVLGNFSANSIKSTEANLVALGNGSPKDLTIVQVFQPTSNATSYRGGWGSTSATTQYLAIRRGATNYLDDVTRRDNTNNSSVVVSGIEHLAPQVCVTVFDATAATVTHYIDGVTTGAVSVPRGTTSTNIWCMGCLPTGASPSIASAFRHRHYMVYGRKLTGPEVQSMTDWGGGEIGVAGIGLRWKGGYTASSTFGNGSNGTLVIGILGQSNDSGRGASGYTSVYAGTTNQGYVLYSDNYLDVASEPTAYPADVIGGAAADSTQAATSYVTRMIDRLRANGETRNIIVVNCAIGGTTSANWNALATTSPPPINGSLGNAKHRISEALKAPNSKLMLVLGQGESNTVGTAGSTVTDWTTHWGGICDHLNTYFAGKFDKTHHFVFRKLHQTAWTLSTSTNWADLRTAQDAIVAARSDAVIAQTHNGPFLLSDNLHVDTGSNTPGSETGLMRTGINIADAIWAAT